MKADHLRRGAAALLGAVGLALLVQGLWIPIKAAAAQVLLEAAWARSLDGNTARPWPWADTWPVARLRAPDHGIDQIVLEGGTGNVLAFAPGRHGLSTPSRPVLGGHRDTHFSFLKDLSLGDELELESTDGRVTRYRASWAAVVDHRDLAILEGDESSLVLVTCWPFDAVVPGGPLRYVVKAEPVPGSLEHVVETLAGQDAVRPALNVLGRRFS